MTEQQKSSDIDEKTALLAEYSRLITAQFEFIKESLPADVQEAYRIVIRLSEFLADPSLSDKTLREAVFDKIPCEKIQWALNIIENWKSEDERYEETREKERKRRQEKGMEEERRLTRKDNEKLSENFDTTLILDAIDALDDLRSILADQYHEEEAIPRPPELRDKLLLLHEKASDLINSDYWHPTDLGLFDLAWEIEDELFSISEKVKRIQKVITELTKLTPDEEYEVEEENEVE